MSNIQILDAHRLMANAPLPIKWAIQGLLPMGVVADIFGPPGAGKSTLLTDLALTIAGETGDWHGKPCIGGPVVILGGERTDPGALSRDLHRAGRPDPGPGQLLVPTDPRGDCPPLWKWNRRADDGAGRWELTAWGVEITSWIAGAKVTTVIVDTVLSAAQGSDLLDQPQQYSLGQAIRAWAKQVGTQLMLTVSHTNQASSGVATLLHDRLDYLSRAGGNGFPGALRHLGGLTKVRDDEVPGLAARDDRSLFALGFSKHNESPPTDWTHFTPAIFSQRNGRVEMVMDGEEVRERLELKARRDKADKGGKTRKEDRIDYRAAKDGQRAAAFAGAGDDWE